MTANVSANNRRIARNALMLYIRMGVTMLVQLYTSRVILEVLGIDDYGIWSLVATLVVSLSFITGPLSAATQRFISFELGTGNKNNAQKVFSQSIILYSVFAVGIILILETVGLWFLNHKLNIPYDKMMIANIVYQFSIASFVVSLIRMPYDATIIAYEKMDFYAYMSIIDVALKLGIVFMLKAFNSIPHLVLYSVLTFSVSLIMTLAYKIYCTKKYQITHIIFKLEKLVMRRIASFSGWSLMGSFAVMTSNQGVNMVLNMFFGVAINATMGIANQVGNAVNQFVSNFQLAFQPQIVKYYAQGDFHQLQELIFRASRFSFLLLFAIAFPIIYNIDAILHLWLGDNVPEYTGTFCSLMIISFLFDALSAPLWMSIQASGNIRNYQIIISVIFLLNIIISYIVLRFGYAPISVMIVRILISIFNLIFRIIFVYKRIDFSLRRYIITIMMRLAGIVLLNMVLINCINLVLPNTAGIISIIINSIIFFAIYAIIVLSCGLDRLERKKIYNSLNFKILN